MDTKTNNKSTFIGAKRVWTFLLLVVSLNTAAQTEWNGTIDSLPLDENIRYGQLKNGFTYYIKSLSEQQSKLQMNLYVKAGSNHSKKDEINISHAVEHLAFKATKNFPEGIGQSEEIKDVGMTIYDLQAFSGSKYTEYFFNAPGNNKKALKTGLIYFKDIVDGLLFTDEDIEVVRGELRQEYLLKIQDPKKIEADTRLTSSIYPCSHDHTNFLSQQAKMDPQTVRAFYEDFYRPDLMAVSVIGAIRDIDQLETLIIKAFGDLNNPKNPKKPKNCDSLYFKRPQQFFTIERKTDPSKLVPNKKVNFHLFYRDPETFYNWSNSQGLKKLMLTDLLVELLVRRFADISKGCSLFCIQNASLYEEDMLAGLLIEAEADNDLYKVAFQEIQKSLAQLEKHGISEEEFQQLKQSYSRNALSDRGEDPRYWKEQIFSHFVLGEALPAQKKQMQKDFIDNLSLRKFNDYLERFLSTGPDDIGIIAPTGSEALNLQEDQVRSWIEEQKKEPVEEFVYSEVSKTLLRPEQVKNLNKKVHYKEKFKARNIKEYDLENGLKLIAQSIEPGSENDKGKIVINGFSGKGVCTIPQEEYYSAIFAPEIILNSGINGFSKHEVEQHMQENGLYPGVLSFYVDYNESGIQGFVEVDQLENLLQLLYLYITSPNESEKEFQKWKKDKLESFTSSEAVEFYHFIKEKTGDPSITDYFKGRKSLFGSLETTEGIGETDLNEARKYFKYFFGDATDFTIVVSGDFEIDEVAPTLVKYFGNLPSGTSKVTTCTTKTETSLPKGPEMFVVPTPPHFDHKNVKYGWKYIKDAPKSDNWKDQMEVEVLGKLANIRGWDLRFKHGFAIYDVLVLGELNKKMNRYEISSYLDLMPEQYSAVRKEVHKIFKDLKSNLVSKEDLHQAVRYVASKRHKLYGSPGTIQKRNEQLFDHYKYGQALASPDEMKEYLVSLTPKDIRRLANKFFQDKNLYEFVMKENEL
ncbi:Predicted Zn-dependent peptidase [Salinimicrobium catena]|uniref:Predicted Zn-dependent peptidase n=1 Tax=Salinimicrobium catena TaxID=390640 RepID=A0A1H5MRK9_9FLAO|nr:insulinase family protein [Salinimicrobium catena]SDL28391.1 Predicted Zn-dependent peptidase [Salinimicrobium catena]SEE92015.1 Predicted Zn-dependent peptidase [Salinimicrobium catena]